MGYDVKKTHAEQTPTMTNPGTVTFYVVIRWFDDSTDNIRRYNGAYLWKGYPTPLRYPGMWERMRGCNKLFRWNWRELKTSPFVNTCKTWYTGWHTVNLNKINRIVLRKKSNTVSLRLERKIVNQSLIPHPRRKKDSRQYFFETWAKFEDEGVSQNFLFWVCYNIMPSRYFDW